MDSDGNWKDVAFSGDQFVGLRHDGSIWGWQASRHYYRVAQLPYSMKERLAPGTNWMEVVGSLKRFFLLRTDGTLFGVGDNRNGELGDGTQQQRPHVVETTLNHRWRSVAAGDVSTAAIGTDGTLWAWGNELGSSPRQVGSATNWIELRARGYLSLARNDGGEFFVWGANAHIAAEGAHRSPFEPLVMLPDSNRWRTIWPLNATLFAQDTNGHFWCWGVGFPNKPATLPSDLRERRPITVPNLSAIWPMNDAVILGSTADGTIWSRGDILGADCSPTASERRRAAIVKWLGKVGITSPSLQRWGQVQTFSTNFVPVAQFVAR